jgi:plastocyanin
MHIGMRLVGFGLLVTVGCASAPVPESTTSGKIFEVQIDDFVIPKVITVKEEDEVRWVNKRTFPVHVSLTKRLGPTISCLKGFVIEGSDFVGSPIPDSVFGATVNSNEFASLCFSETGIYEYTVRTDKNSGEEASKLAGTVMVK